MPSRSFNSEDIAKLKKLFVEGSRVLREMEDLKEGLKETVKAIAEEMDMKPATLNKALKIAHKNALQQEQSAFAELEEVLEAAGHTL
jgi:hypothetical protein